MMKLFALFLSFASLTVVYSQTADSVHADTTRSTKVDTLVSDTTGLFSTKKAIAKADTLIPIYQNPLFPASQFIDKKKIDFLDYRFTGDLFSPFGLSFQRNYGFAGYPNELMLYGTNEISFFENGIYVNNRSSNRFNLNLMPSEMIDSIEIIPSPRGFLYGPASSPAAVNFIERDIFPTAPYTRIKYYEGPNGEAFIDAVLSAIMFRDFIFKLDISNRKVDLTYVNSTFSIWQGEAHLKYLLSEKTNISLFYGYNDYDAGLNGGVNVDSISMVTSDINEILYDVQVAPVYYPEKRLNILQHNVGLRLFTDPVKYLHTDLSLYYRFSNDEVSNPPEVQNYPRRTKDKTTGALLKQDVSFAFADLRVLAQYEKTHSDYYVPGSNMALSESHFTLSPVLSLNLIDSTIIPSVYYKFQNINDAGSRSYNGLGFDAALNPLKYLKLYGGYSNYKSADLSGNVNTIQISAKLNIDNLSLGFDFINRNESFLYVHPSIITGEGGYYLDLGTTQVGGNLGIRVWKLLLEAGSFYDLSKHEPLDNAPAASITSPKIKLTGGLYLDGYFFDENLELKTGFAVNYNSAQRIFISGAEQSLAHSFVTVDFTLAGEIKKAAVAYFTWENLFDRTYYMVPYYPMFRRGIRFGVAWELFN
jgi:outer membrane receptor protein involved in Fe transport